MGVLLSCGNFCCWNVIMIWGHHHQRPFPGGTRHVRRDKCASLLSLRCCFLSRSASRERYSFLAHQLLILHRHVDVRVFISDVGMDSSFRLICSVYITWLYLDGGSNLLFFVRTYLTTPAENTDFFVATAKSFRIPYCLCCCKVKLDYIRVLGMMPKA
jgi:hypothetical protein